MSGGRRATAFPVGVDYYPLDDEHAPWDAWYGGDVEGDFAAMVAAGLSFVRVFASWKALEPQVGQYGEDAFERLSRVLDAAEQVGLRVIVCVFAADPRADLLDIAWGRKRDPHSDSYLIARQIALGQRLASRFRTHPALFCWDIANEAYCAGFKTSQELTAWVNAIREGIREVDHEHPVLLSVDAETLRRETWVDAREALMACDIACTHVTSAYRSYAADGPLAAARSTYLPGFLARTSAGSGVGVALLSDRIGPGDLASSLAEEASYVRAALWSSLTNGASGVLLQRWRDLAVDERDVYSLDPFDALIGLVGTDGSAKPTLAEVTRFARVSARLDLRQLEPAPARLGILMPSERFDSLPSVAGLFDPRACFQAYVCATQSHVPAAVIDESESFDELSVLVVPSATHIAEKTWARLAAFVQAGGWLVLSYGGGELPASASELFGVEFLGDMGSRGRLVCRVVQPEVVGGLEPFEGALDVQSFAHLRAERALCSCADEAGIPLLTANQHGQGRAVLIAGPLERALALAEPDAAPAATAWLAQLYASVAEGAGCGAPVRCDAASVEVALLQGSDEDVLIGLNHSADKTAALVTCGHHVMYATDLGQGARVRVDSSEFTVSLGPHGAVALRLSSE